MGDSQISGGLSTEVVATGAAICDKAPTRGLNRVAIAVMYQPDETIRLEVRVENETVWLTQQQMAELFNATKQNISLHINNIYDEGELEQIATVKDYLTVQKEGKRMVKRHINLQRHNQQYPPITVNVCQHNH